MSEMLPLFPLKLVVFPGEYLNLHIFEPRYKQLIGECEKESRPFGIPPFINGTVGEIGTEIKLQSIEKLYPGGEMDIKTVGVGIFRINEFFKEQPGKLYAGANIAAQPWSLEDGNSENRVRIRSFMEKLFAALGVKQELPPPIFNTFDIGHKIGLKLEQEYELLQIESELERQEYILLHLDEMLPRIEEMEKIRKKIQMNGHFRNIQPPKL